ncbi:MAG: winged helix-turn-helix domain-containing protein [Bdellovibrionota bacterium]
MSKTAKKTRPAKAARPVKSPQNAASIVEKTAEAIAFRIVSGKYAANERLPSVRKLAEEFGINPSTVQVVLAHLESSGFVTPRQGLGFLVRDVERFGGIPTWRYVFRFAQFVPEKAAKIYEDLLDMRVVLIAEALEKIAEDPKRYDPSSVRGAVEKLDLLITTEPQNIREIARAELHATRLLMLAAGQSVVTAVLNSIGEIYLDVPVVLKAMYAELPKNRFIWRTLLLQWERGQFSSKAIPQLRTLLRQYDEGILERFRKMVSSPEYRPAAVAG